MPAEKSSDPKSKDDKRDKNILVATMSEFSEDDCMTMSAALAYYTAFSLPPLLVLIVTVAGLIWNPDAITGQLEQQMTGVIGNGGWEQVETMMRNAGSDGAGGIAALVSIAVLLFGATAVVGQLQHALNTAWAVQPDPQGSGVKNFLFKRILSLGMILGIAFLLIVSLVLTTVLQSTARQMQSWLPGGIASWMPLAIDAIVNLIVLTLLFAAMFKWLPDAEVEWRDTWTGAAVTAVLFLVAKFALGYYFAMQGPASTYGPAASFALILLWVYYSSIILLIGAEFTQVWARRHGSRIQPSPGAVRVLHSTKHLPTSPEGTPAGT